MVNKTDLDFKNLDEKFYSRLDEILMKLDEKRFLATEAEYELSWCLHHIDQVGRLAWTRHYDRFQELFQKIES